MKKILAVIGMVVLLSLVFSVPAAAAPGKANGPPVRSVDNATILFSEDIGGMQVTICGGAAPAPPLYIPTPNQALPARGTFVSHLLFPASGVALEESWFQVTQFTGYIVLAKPGVTIPLYFDFEGSIKVMVHNGTQKNQPIISIRSSAPVHLNIPGMLPDGMYSNIQMVGWGNIVHAE